MNGYLPGLATNHSILSRHTLFGAVVALMLCPAQGWGDAPLTRFRQQTSELLKQEATASAGQAKEAAIAALCDMYVVMRSDDRYATSEMLQGDSAKIRRRLLSIARQRTNELKRNKVPRPDSLSSEVESAITSALESESTVSDLLQPSKLGGHAGGAAMDNGWQLVELIQRIVTPDFWDSLGGPGTIRYFAMRRVLVVRATSDVHEQIKDLLIALR